MSRSTHDIKMPQASNMTLKGDVWLALLALVALVLVLGLVFNDWQPEVSSSVGPRIGTLVRKGSDVRRRAAGSLVWQRVVAGADIHERDALYVAADSDAQVLLLDGSRVDIDPSSLVVLSYERTAEADVVRGGAGGVAGRGALALRSGNVVARLAESGVGRLMRTTEDVARFAVSAGQGVLQAQGGEHTVAAGERQSIAGNERIVEALGPGLLAPEAGARVVVEARADLVFRWRPAGEATFELSRDASFVAPTRSVATSATELAVEGIEPGIYYWRLRGNAFVSEERKLIVLRDAPPVITTPMNAAIVDLSSNIPAAITFTPSPEAESYDVELVRDGLAPVVLSTPHATLLLFREAVGAREGSYCARARARRGDGVGAFGPAVCFRVVLAPILKAPELYEPKHEKATPKKQGFRFDPWLLLGSVAHAAAPLERVTLRWEHISGASHYLLEVARDAEFTQVVVREQAPSNYHAFSPPGPELFYWRVRAVDGEAREGALSVVRELDLRLSPTPSEPVKVPRKAATAPRLTAPENDATHDEAAPLSWQHKTGKTFEIQVATTDDFTNAEVYKSTQPSLTVSPAEGRYFWRVRVAEPRGPWSESRRFRVQPASPPAEPLLSFTQAGPFLGFFDDLAHVRTLRVGADLEARGHRVLSRLRILARTSYYTTNRPRSGLAAVNARLHSLPTDGLAYLAFTPAYITIMAGVGFTLAPYWATGQRGGLGLNVGGLVSMAALYDLESSALAATLSLGVASANAERLASSPGGLTFTLGYRFQL